MPRRKSISPPVPPSPSIDPTAERRSPRGRNPLTPRDLFFLFLPESANRDKNRADVSATLCVCVCVPARNVRRHCILAVIYERRVELRLTGSRAADPIKRRRGIADGVALSVLQREGDSLEKFHEERIRRRGSGARYQRSGRRCAITRPAFDASRIRNGSHLRSNSIRYGTCRALGRPSITDHRRVAHFPNYEPSRRRASRITRTATTRPALSSRTARSLAHPQSDSAIYDVLIHVRSFKHTRAHMHTHSRTRAGPERPPTRWPRKQRKQRRTPHFSHARRT